MNALDRWTSILPVCAALVALLGATAAPANAQATGTVRGTVIAAETLRPLSGAQVNVVGTGRGTLTNSAGEYLIPGVPAGSRTVRVQMIGYEVVEQTVDVSADASATADFRLEVTAIALEEVVVTATGEARRREIGNSLSSISSKEIEVAPVQNTQQIIAGRSPGVTVIANSGQPGAGGTIRLRGNNSVSQGNNPIIYVDGVRIFSGNAPAAWASHQSTLPLNDINAEDIERVEIVKGAAATTLYGTEAAGGVIQIFTKKGMTGAPTWSAEVSGGVNTAAHFGPPGEPTGLFFRECSGPNLVNSEGEAFVDPTCPASGSWLRNGPIQRYSLSVRGGGENMSYFLSGNYADENGIVETGWSKDGGFRGNFSFAPARGLDISVSSSYSKRVTRWVPDGNNASGFALNVTRGPANNFKAGLAGECENVDVTCVTNAYILDQKNFNRNDHFISGLTIDYAPGERLRNRFTVGYDFNQADNETQYPFGYLRSPKGFLWGQVWNNSTLSLDYLGSFRSGFLGEGNTSRISWGGQLFEDRRNYKELDAYDFAGPGEPTLTSAARTEIFADSRLRVINAGLFGEAVLGFADRLFLTAGLRVDGNSAFGQSFGLQPYPKLSASYVLSDHSFWPSAWWSAMKLRGAVGESGKAPGAFDAVRVWTPIAADDGQPGFSPSRLGNENLGPERTREYELGFDAGFLDGRVGVDLTYYNQTTSEALIDVQQPPSEGFIFTQLENVGEIRNSGVEVAFDTDLLRTENLGWSARVNYSRNRSEALDLGGQEIGLAWRNVVREGYPVPSFWGDVVINPNEFAEPIIVRDTFIGPSYPTRNIGVGTTITFLRDFTFDALAEYQGGHYQLNGPGMQNSRRGVWQPCYETQAKLRAAEAGDASALNDVTALDRLKCAIDRREMDYAWWIQPADFIKLRNASLTYNIPQRLLRGTRSASITVAGTNLFTSTDYDGIDPESNELGQFLRRAEYYNLPPTRTLLLSLRVGF